MKPDRNASASIKSGRGVVTNFKAGIGVSPNKNGMDDKEGERRGHRKIIYYLVTRTEMGSSEFENAGDVEEQNIIAITRT